MTIARHKLNKNKIIEKFSAPLLYSGFWLTIHFLILDMSYPLYAIAVSLGYGLGYFLAQQKRGHIGLSADSYALPFAVMIVIVSIIISTQFQMMPSDHELWSLTVSALIKAFLISFIGAHLFLLACVFIYSYITDK